MTKQYIAQDIVPVCQACFAKRIRELRGDHFSDDRDMVSMSEVQTYLDIVENVELIQFILGLDKTYCSLLLPSYARPSSYSIFPTNTSSVAASRSVSNRLGLEAKSKHFDLFGPMSSSCVSGLPARTVKSCGT